MATAPSVVVLWCIIEYIRQLEVRRVTSLTRVVLVFGCGLKRDCVVVVCVVGFGLAVFLGASSFNSDVSKWNTGAVTTMASSKCTLSPSLWPRRLSLWCVVEYIRHLEVRRATRLTRVVLVFGCGLKREPCCCCLCGGFGLSLFHCCTLLSSCSVCFRICVQSKRVHLEYGGGDKYGSK